jgi:hypothetical protein
VLGSSACDVDADGRAELLVVSAKKQGSGSFARRISVYRTGDLRGAEPAAWRAQDVPDDVVAYTCGDVLARGNPQLVYLTPNAVFAADFEGGAPSRVIADHKGIATQASPQSLPHWSGLRDLDQDGLADLVLPEARGYAVYRQQKERGLVRTGAIEIPAQYANEPTTRRLRRVRAEGELLERRSLPQVVATDLDADRKLDLLALEESSVFGFAQRDGLAFASAPTLRRKVVAQPDDPFQDLSEEATRPNVRFGDIDGDGRTDLVVPELDAGDLVTRLRVFMAGPEGLTEKPSQVLKLSSLGGDPQLTDMNGDGRLDLGCTTVRTDLLRAVTSPTVPRLTFTYYAFLYRGEQRAFSTRPDVQWDVSVELADPAARDGSDAAPSGFIRLDGDFDGDKVHDLARLGALGDLAVHAGQVEGADRLTLRIAADPLLSARVKPTSRSRIEDVDGDGRSDVVLLYDESLVLLLTRS